MAGGATTESCIKLKGKQSVATMAICSHRTLTLSHTSTPLVLVGDLLSWLFAVAGGGRYLSSGRANELFWAAAAASPNGGNPNRDQVQVLRSIRRPNSSASRSDAEPQASRSSNPPNHPGIQPSFSGTYPPSYTPPTSSVFAQDSGRYDKFSARSLMSQASSVIGGGGGAREEEPLGMSPPKNVDAGGLRNLMRDAEDDGSEALTGPGGDDFGDGYDKFSARSLLSVGSVEMAVRAGEVGEWQQRQAGDSSARLAGGIAGTQSKLERGGAARASSSKEQHRQGTSAMSEDIVNTGTDQVARSETSDAIPEAGYANFEPLSRDVSDASLASNAPNPGRSQTSRGDSGSRTRAALTGAADVLARDVAGADSDGGGGRERRAGSMERAEYEPFSISRHGSGNSTPTVKSTGSQGEEARMTRGLVVRRGGGQGADKSAG